MPVGKSLVRLAATRPDGWRAYQLRFVRSLKARIEGIQVIAYGAISVKQDAGMSAEIHGWHQGAPDGRRGRDLLRRVRRALRGLGYMVTARSTSFSACRTLRSLADATSEAQALDTLTLGRLVKTGQTRPVHAPRTRRPRVRTLRETDELVWQALPVLRRAVKRAWGVEALLLAREAPVRVPSIAGTWALRTYVLLVSPEGVELDVEVQRPRGATRPPPLVRRVFRALPRGSTWHHDSRWLHRCFGRTERSLRAAMATAAEWM